MAFKKYIHPFWYAVTDYFAAAIAWMLFYFFRKKLLDEPLLTDETFWLGVFFIPVGWLVIYALTGSYNSVYKKSRLTEFTTGFISSLLGCMGLFFLFILDDVKSNYNYYYSAFGLLFGTQFLLAWVGRLFILSIVKNQLVTKTIRFRSAIVGSGENALQIFKDAEKKLEVEGYYTIGYIGPPDNGRNGTKTLPRLGSLDQLETIIEENKIELIILAIDKTSHNLIENIINRLSEINVAVKIQPSVLDILAGSVKTSNVMGAALIDLHTGLMPQWQQNIKRVVDITAAFLSLIVLSPLLVFVAIRVRASSKGSVFFFAGKNWLQGQAFYHV